MAIIQFETAFLSGIRADQPTAADADQKFYQVEDEGNIIERSDGATWSQWGPSASGGGLILVENKIISSTVSTVTFSGLDGNTDGIYLLIAKILATASTFYALQPNGATTNLAGGLHYSDGSTTGISNSTTVAHIGFGDNTRWSTMRVDIFAKKNAQSPASPLTYMGNQGYFNGANSILGVCGGIWNETSTNMTSLEVISTAANCIADGSQLALYKYPQS